MIQTNLHMYWINWCFFVTGIPGMNNILIVQFSLADSEFWWFATIQLNNVVPCMQSYPIAQLPICKRQQILAQDLPNNLPNSVLPKCPRFEGRRRHPLLGLISTENWKCGAQRNVAQFFKYELICIILTLFSYFCFNWKQIKSCLSSTVVVKYVSPEFHPNAFFPKKFKTFQVSEWTISRSEKYPKGPYMYSPWSELCLKFASKASGRLVLDTSVTKLRNNRWKA